MYGAEQRAGGSQGLWGPLNDTHRNHGSSQLAPLDDLERALTHVGVDMPGLVPGPVVDVRHGGLDPHPQIVVPDEPPRSQERGIVVLLPGGPEVALPVGRHPAVEAAQRFVVGEAEVELADRRGLIPPPGKFFHEHRTRLRDPPADVLPLAVGMRILASDPGVARRDADGPRRIVPPKDSALAAEPIQGGHLQETMADRGHVQGALVVGRDQQDVGPTAGLPGRSAGVGLGAWGSFGHTSRERERHRAHTGLLKESSPGTRHGIFIHPWAHPQPPTRVWITRNISQGAPATGPGRVEPLASAEPVGARHLSGS